MPDSPEHVKVEGVDWGRVIPAVHLVGLFRVAMQPTKLLLALVLVAVVYAGGYVLAAVMQPGTAGGVQGTAYFEQLVSRQTESLGHVVGAATSLDLGLDGGGLVGAVMELAVWNPWEAIQQGPWFLGFLGVFKFLVVAVVGTAIARLAATQLCLKQTHGLGEAVGFTARKGVWSILAPLIPASVLLGLGVVLVLLGVVFFNLPGLHVIGGIAFGPMLLLGLAMALILLALALAFHLLIAAVAVEGTDGYDAVSRCFAYVAARPWQWLFYGLVALIYGAITFLFVWAVVMLGFLLTVSMLEWGAFRVLEAGGFQEVSWLAATLPEGWGGAAGRVENDGWLGLTAWIMRGWLLLLAAIPVAYAVSFYFCAAVQVYLLLRRSAEGSAFSDCYDADEAAEVLGEGVAVPAKVEGPSDA